MVMCNHSTSVIVETNYGIMARLEALVSNCSDLTLDFS